MNYDNKPGLIYCCNVKLSSLGFKGDTLAQISRNKREVACILPLASQLESF